MITKATVIGSQCTQQYNMNPEQHQTTVRTDGE